MKMMKSQSLDNEYIIRGNNHGKESRGKYTKKQINKVADKIFGTKKEIENIGKRGRGRPKGSTNKPKTTKRSEAPIKSERSKIEAANKAAANKRNSKSIAKKALKATPAAAAKKTGGRGNIRATALGLGASAAAIGTCKQKETSPAQKETFAEAFKKARAKGEGTKFTHNGKIIYSCYQD